MGLPCGEHLYDNCVGLGIRILYIYDLYELTYPEMDVGKQRSALEDNSIFILF